MNDDEVRYDQRRLLRLVARHLVLLLVCVAVGVVLAAGRLAASGVSHKAVSAVQVGEPATVQSLTSTGATARDQARLVDAQVHQLKSHTLSDAVDAKLPSGHPPYSVDFAAGATTNVVTITATSTSPSLAKTVANAYATTYLDQLQASNGAVIDATSKQLSTSISAINDQLTKLESTLSGADSDSLSRVQAIVTPTRSALLDQRSELQRQLDVLILDKTVGLAGGARVVQQADTSFTSPVALVSPVVLGGLLGALIGLALITLIELRSGRVHDTADVTTAGLHPRAVWTLDVGLPAKTSEGQAGAPSGREVAAYRRLAALLWAGSAGSAAGGLAPVTLFAPVDGDRAAGVALAARLGQQLGQMQRRVVVVQADPGRELERYLPGPSGPGLSEVLRGEHTLDEALRPTSGGRVQFLVAGQDPDAAQLGSPALAELLHELAGRVDHVLVAGAPLTASAESLLVAPHVDRVVALVRRGRTPRKLLQQFAGQVGAPVAELAALQQPDVVIHGGGRGGARPAATSSRSAARSRSALPADG